jgi:hypothetical protein
MVDTYHARAARGAVAQIPGYQTFEARNPVMAPGQFVAPANIYGGAPRSVASRRAATFKRLDDLRKQANAANEARYNEARGLLGMEDPNAWQKAGFGDPTSYAAHQARLAGEAAATAAPPLPGASPAFVAAAGGNLTPQAMASRVQAKQRGIYNTSTALNQEAVKNSLALQDADRTNRALAMQEQQVAEASRRAEQARADALRAERLNLLYRKNDIAPRTDEAMAAAAAEGDGTTEGMSYPMASGGGGGNRGGQGGAPQMTFEQMERLAEKQKKAMADAQFAAAVANRKRLDDKFDKAERIRAAKYLREENLRRTLPLNMEEIIRLDNQKRIRIRPSLRTQ